MELELFSGLLLFILSCLVIFLIRFMLLLSSGFVGFRFCCGGGSIDGLRDNQH